MSPNQRTLLSLGCGLLLLTGCAPPAAAVPVAPPTPSSSEVLPTELISRATASPQIAFTPIANSAAIPFSAQLEDTRIRLDDGPGNIAWSHNGDLLAYTYSLTLYIVPVGRWREQSEVFSASLDDGRWDLGSDFLSWSPDDASIGVTLEKPANSHRLEGRMAQVDWRHGTFSLMAPNEEATLIDWSATNRIVAFRGLSGPWLFDVSTHLWQSLVREETAGIEGLGFPHWSPDGNLVVAKTEGLVGLTKEIAFYKVARDTNQWRPLNINIETFFPHTGNPVPSPDGRWIAWIEGHVTKEGDIWRILLYDQKNGAITEAINSRPDQTNMWKALTWSPDSRQLAFSAGHGAPYDQTIWVLHLDALR